MRAQETTDSPNTCAGDATKGPTSSIPASLHTRFPADHNLTLQTGGNVRAPRSATSPRITSLCTRRLKFIHWSTLVPAHLSVFHWSTLPTSSLFYLAARPLLPQLGPPPPLTPPLPLPLSRPAGLSGHAHPCRPRPPSSLTCLSPPFLPSLPFLSLSPLQPRTRRRCSAATPPPSCLLPPFLPLAPRVAAQAGRPAARLGGAVRPAARRRGRGSGTAARGGRPATLRGRPPPLSLSPTRRTAMAGPWCGDDHDLGFSSPSLAVPGSSEAWCG